MRQPRLRRKRTEKIEVVVPSAADYQMTEEEQMLWDATKAVLEMGLHVIKDDAKVYSVMLSRITREIRRKHGVAGAKKVLQGLIDTMDEVVTMDRHQS